MASHLSVNLNAIALLRNRRDLAWPSVTGIGALALEAGAHGLTVHPRPDERHIRVSDVFEISQMIKERFEGAEFNIEGYPTAEFMALIEKVAPDQVTFVPDDPSQETSDHGWDIGASLDFLKGVVKAAQAAGSRVSLFVDAEPEMAIAAKSVGADRIEIYTGPYGALSDDTKIELELTRIAQTAEAAIKAGLKVNAGHDLTLDNLPALMTRVPSIAECSIGHGLTADCLIYGTTETIKRYLTALRN